MALVSPGMSRLTLTFTVRNDLTPELEIVNRICTCARSQRLHSPTKLSPYWNTLCRRFCHAGNGQDLKECVSIWLQVIWNRTKIFFSTDSWLSALRYCMSERLLASITLLSCCCMLPYWNTLAWTCCQLSLRGTNALQYGSLSLPVKAIVRISQFSLRHFDVD